MEVEKQTRSKTIFMLPNHKITIDAAIGPASESPEMLERLISAGLSVAKINLSHGHFTEHANHIARIRAAERPTGRRVAIMADLPGPKIRIGMIKPEPIHLFPGDAFSQTTDDIVGTAQRVSTSFDRLLKVLKSGNRLFLKDGLVQLLVEHGEGNDVHCQVAIGGELRSKKALNLPDIDLWISVFTVRDRACLEFAIQKGLNAVSQSFVETAADIEAVQSLAKGLGRQPFIIAKIERSDALRNFDDILRAADGIMVARSDQRVKVPIEAMAILQSSLLRRRTSQASQSSLPRKCSNPWCRVAFLLAPSPRMWPATRRRCRAWSRLRAHLAPRASDCGRYRRLGGRPIWKPIIASSSGKLARNAEGNCSRVIQEMA